MRYRIVGRGGAIRLRDFDRPSMFTEELWVRILDDVGDLVMGQVRGGSLYLIRTAVRDFRNYVQDLQKEGVAGLNMDSIGDHALKEELKRIRKRAVGGPARGRVEGRRGGRDRLRSPG